MKPFASAARLLLPVCALLCVLLPAAAGGQPLVVVDVRQSSPAEGLTTAAIQGIVNRGPEPPCVFLMTRERDAEWLDYSLRISPREVSYVPPGELLDMFRSDVHGQVLYDPERAYTLDIATTAAALRDAVPTATDLGLPTVLDLRDRWSSRREAYEWALTSLLPECNAAMAAVLPSGSIGPRDFAVQRRMFVMAAPPAPGDAAFDSLLFRLAPGAAIYGHVPSSLESTLSEASHFLVRASEAANLSFMSRIEPDRRSYQYPGHLEPRSPRYLCMIFDCTDLSFALNEMPRIWADPARGTLPLGWALPGSLAEVAPVAAHCYYADAYASGTDQFVLGRSGAGEITVSLASAPYSFFRATSKAMTELDADVTLYRGPADPSAIPHAVADFSAETGARGVFLTDVGDRPPALHQGVPALAAPRFQSVQAATDYLDRVPLDRRCVTLLLDPVALRPKDAAHIASYVSDRYVIVPPAEMMELMREMSAPTAAGGAVVVSSVDYSDEVTADEPIHISAEIESTIPLSSCAVVYRQVGGLVGFSEPMGRARDGYVAEIPPLLPGGSFEFRVRVRDAAGNVAWSPPWTLEVPRADGDRDGLADAEEAFLLSDPADPDTDGDGLTDGNDPNVLLFNKALTVYFGPLSPPSELPYLAEAGATQVEDGARRLLPGQTCLYWLPLPGLPPEAPVVVALEAEGPLALAAGPDASSWAVEHHGFLEGVWYSPLLPSEVRRTGILVRASCPTEADAPAVIGSIAATSPPEAPSIVRVSRRPTHPGPEQAIQVTALIFSPRGVADASLTYCINEGGTITIPMQRVAGTETYHARIPSLENRDRLEYWITASDEDGHAAATTVSFTPVGCRGREVVSLLAAHDFIGDWVWAPEWDGAARAAPSDGCRDAAHVNLTGGRYTIWLLGGGRGQSLAVSIEGREIAVLDPLRPDGWHNLGRIRLEAGRYDLELVSRYRLEAPPGAAPRYGALILSADSTFTPHPGTIFDAHNTLTLLSPSREETLSDQVEFLATGAGNFTSVEFSLDGEMIERVSGPPFRLSVNTRRLPSGTHSLRTEAVDRAGPTGLAITIPVTIAN